MHFHHEGYSGYFFIRSRQNGKVLDVEGGSSDAGVRICIWPKKDYDNDNQLWKFEEGFLVNKRSGLVIDIQSGELAPDRNICQYDRKWVQEANNQRWGYEDGFIYCRARPDLVLDIRGGDDSDGTEVIVYNKKYEDNYNQKWEVEKAE
ncbi:ricin B lectin domain-containing protein [Endogone sp. FLAS-F59071]|nr:ricin B lectin domain-containing protein [Endogone sp. FLAS-F59071]|eukprot:RUS14907.1 ricin B lectin domain-containing protein [Endogone sp. FLAS-F59071]